LKKIEEKNVTFEDFKMVVWIFMSHGDENHILTADHKLELDEIYKKLMMDDIPSLRGKPRVFLFQVGCQLAKNCIKMPDYGM